MQDFPFTPNDLDLANEEIKRDSRSTETILNKPAFCIGSTTARQSCTTLQSGWIWSNWRWAGICPYNPCQHPRNQHSLLLHSLTQVAPHKMQSRNFLSLRVALLLSQGCPWPFPAIIRSWEDLTARIQQDQPANPRAGQWVVTGVLERKIHLLSSLRACLGNRG